MANKFFSGRIPKALNEHAEEYAEASGKNKTKILIEALTQYTGYGSTTGTKNSRSLPLSELVEQLQQQIEKHQEKLNRHEQDIELVKNQLIDGAKPKISQTENTVISSEQNLSKPNDEKIEGEKKNIDKTVCLSESAWERLKEMAEQQGVTQTEVIDRLLERDDKNIEQAIKILREIWVSRKMATGAIKNQVRDALFYLDKTQNLKKL